MLSLAVIYIVCTAIDYLRIRFIEKPLFQCLEDTDVWDGIVKLYFEGTFLWNM